MGPSATPTRAIFRPAYPITGAEYEQALALAARHGLQRLDQRRPCGTW